MMIVTWICYDTKSFKQFKTALRMKSTGIYLTGYVNGTLRCITVSDIRELAERGQVISQDATWAAGVLINQREFSCWRIPVTPQMKATVGVRLKLENRMIRGFGS